MSDELPMYLERAWLQIRLGSTAEDKAQKRARFLSASPDLLSTEEWMGIVRGYRASIVEWELAEDAYVAYLRTH